MLHQQKKTNPRVGLFYSNLFHSPLDSLFLADFVDAFDDEAGKEVRRVGEKDGQDEENCDVEQRTEYADLGDDGEADVFDKANVAVVEVVEIHLERVGEDRRDGDVNGEEDADDLDVALRAEFVELKRDGKHKVEHNEVVEENGVEIGVRAKEIPDIAVRVDYRRHQDHIQRERSEAGECRGIRDVAEFAVVKCVEGKKIKEKAAVVEGQGVQVVRAVDAGVYLLAYLEHEKRDRDDLKREIFKARLAFCKQLCQKDRE